MASLAKTQVRKQSLPLSLSHHRPSFSKPLSSISFKPSQSFKSFSIRASSSSSSNSRNPKPSLLQSLSSPILKTACIAVAAAALFLTRLHLKPALATPVVTPPSLTTETTEESAADEEQAGGSAEDVEQERNIEDHLARNPKDIDALRALIEVRLKLKKVAEAIEVINRLIDLEPEEQEWLLLRAQIHIYNEDFITAKNEYEEILAKDPTRVEAYHGLVMSYSETGLTLSDLEVRIEEAMKKCSMENKMKDLRDFKLLIAQIRVMEGNHLHALRAYQQLVEEEPKDFRPYLCQGILYTLLKREDEAQKQFEIFRKLVPKDHPYREYFADNDMVGSRLFGERPEMETAGSNS